MPSYGQFMEDFHWEVALRELNTPPRDPPLTPWENPVGNRNPDVDDQEVTFLRGRGWEPRGQPLLPPTPTQPDEDIGHLINTMATRVWLGTPHINNFSGKAMPGKMEVTFELCYHWGKVCKRPLSGISGLGEYHAITKGGSSGYGQVHGPYHQCGPYPTKINGYFWHCGIIQHLYAKFLQSDTEQPQEGFLLCHKARRDP